MAQAFPVRRYGKLLILVLCVAAVLLFGWYQFVRSPSAPAPAESGRRMGWDAPAVVRAVPAELTDLDVQIKSIGTVTPLNTVVVKSRVDGVLDRIAFEEGAEVEQGDLLAEIDPRPYKAQLEETEGQLQQNRARLENARADLVLYERLWEQDSIAGQQLSDQRALVGELDGTIRTNQAQVDDARLQLSWTRMEAPISGKLGLRNMDPGNLISSGDADGLVTITQMQPIAVNFTVPEVELSALRTAFQGEGELRVDAMDRNEQQVLASGELTTLDNQIDTTTGTLRVRARFENADYALFPNQFVNVRLRLNTLSSVVTIPTDAVQFGTDRSYVYIIEDNKAFIREVTLGASANDRVAVTQGLEAGELVVLEGLDRLRDGKEVSIPDAEGNASAPATQARPSTGEGAGEPPAGDGRRGPPPSGS